MEEVSVEEEVLSETTIPNLFQKGMFWSLLAAILCVPVGMMVGFKCATRTVVGWDGHCLMLLAALATGVFFCFHIVLFLTALFQNTHGIASDDNKGEPKDFYLTNTASILLGVYYMSRLVMNIAGSYWQGPRGDPQIFIYFWFHVCLVLEGVAVLVLVACWC